MRSLVVFESMYGNTRLVAEAVGEGLADSGPTEVASIHDVGPERLADVDLLVVGGPTHVHGLSRDSTRQAAVEAAADPAKGLSMDPDHEGDGVREWLDACGQHPKVPAAAFDTRVDVPAAFSGRASKGIAKRLHHHGFDLVVPARSFLVTKETHLEPDEEDHARAWGRKLGELLTTRV